MSPLIFFDENMVVASFAPVSDTAFARQGGENKSRGWIKDSMGKVHAIPRPYPEYPADYLFMENIPGKKAVYILPEEGLHEASAKPFHTSSLYTVMQIDTDEEESKEKTKELERKIEESLQKAKIETVYTFTAHYIYLFDWHKKNDAYEALKTLTLIYI